MMRDACDEVTLRDVEADDVSVFYEFQNDPVASAMADFPIRSWDAHASHWARILDDDATVNRTVLVDGRVAGSIASFPEGSRREVGYWLGRDFWGRGIATRALALFLMVEERRPLYAFVARHNGASRRVLEKCGFMVTTGDSDGYRLELRG
jgi:RimJ/RimL family protein N-acetyltransferase